MYPKKKKKDRIYNHPFNDAIDAMTAEIMVKTEDKKLFDIIRNSDWFRKSRIPSHEDIWQTAEAIQKSIRQGLGEKVTP